jgi:uncharacterized membrane protein
MNGHHWSQQEQAERHEVDHQKFLANHGAQTPTMLACAGLLVAFVGAIVEIHFKIELPPTLIGKLLFMAPTAFGLLSVFGLLAHTMQTDHASHT